MLIEKKQVFTDGSSCVSEQSFGIGNVGAIMDILRNKMYSEPITAIAREISCNARDAHREIGTPNRPIEVTLPTYLVNEFKIRDFGVGISKDRMNNIFIQYGNTTKDLSNEETGGFGLGAKTPFSYTNQFNIRTITKENDGTNIERLYLAYIDTSQKGKLRLLHEKTTDQETGTEIFFNVKNDDSYKFIQAIVKTTLFWSVKPIFNNLEDKDFKKYAEHDISSEPVLTFNNISLYSRGYYARGSTLFVLLDEILYPVLLQKEITDKLNPLIEHVINKFSIVIKLNTGDLDVVPSREHLNYTNKTLNVLKNNFDFLTKSVEEILTNSATQQLTYIDAIHAVVSTCKMLNINAGSNIIEALNLTWNNKKIFFKLAKDKRFKFYSLCMGYKRYNIEKISKQEVYDIDLSVYKKNIFLYSNISLASHTEQIKELIINSDDKFIFFIVPANKEQKTDFKTNVKKWLAVNNLTFNDLGVKTFEPAKTIRKKKNTPPNTGVYALKNNQIAKANIDPQSVVILVTRDDSVRISRNIQLNKIDYYNFTTLINRGLIKKDIVICKEKELKKYKKIFKNSISLNDEISLNLDFDKLKSISDTIPKIQKEAEQYLHFINGSNYNYFESEFLDLESISNLVTNKDSTFKKAINVFKQIMVVVDYCKHNDYKAIEALIALGQDEYVTELNKVKNFIRFINDSLGEKGKLPKTLYDKYPMLRLFSAMPAYSKRKYFNVVADYINEIDNK